MSISDTSKSFDELKSAANELIQQLKKSKEFNFQGELTPNEFARLRNLIITHWPNLFSPSDSICVLKQLNIDSLSVRLDKTVSGLFTFADTANDAFNVKNDPFGLGVSSLSKLSALIPADSIVINDGFITDKDHTRILFFAEISGTKLDHKTTKAIYRTIKAIEDQIESKGFTLTWMGKARASLENAQTSRLVSVFLY